MVLGLVTGSMPMLVSLLLMQGITLTMWRSFLDKTIPQYDSEKWRKSLEQVVRGGVAGGDDATSAPASITTASQQPSSIKLEPSTPLSTFDQPQADPVTNSLQILANMDPKLIQLLGQLQNHDSTGQPISATTSSPLTSATEQLNLLNSLASLLRSLPNQGDVGTQPITELFDPNDLKNPNHLLQQSPSPYIQYTQIDPSDRLKYYEVSSDHSKIRPNKNIVDEDFGSHKYPIPEAEDISEDPDNTEIKYLEVGDQPEQPGKPEKPIEPGKDLYEEVDYDNEDAQNQDELDESEEEEEEDDDYDDQDQDPKGTHRRKIRIRERINPGRIFAASKNRIKLLKPNLVKTSMFGKPRIQKRMLRFESGPFQYAQTKLKRKFLNSIHSIPFLRRNTKKKIRPAYEPSWKRTGNPSKGNFRFVTPSAPILLPVSNRSEDVESGLSVKHQRKSSKPAAKNIYKKSLKLKSNKITLTDIEEIQDDCSNIPKSKNGKPFKEVWSQKNGWNKCHPKSPNFRLAKGIVVPNLVDTRFNLSATTLEPLGITEAEVHTDQTTTPEPIMVTTVAITESPITTTTTTVATPVEVPNKDLFLIDFNNLLMTLTTTTTVAPLTTTMDPSYIDELPKEFLAHILKAIDSSKIDNFQANPVIGQEPQNHQPTKAEQNKEPKDEDNEEDSEEDIFDETLIEENLNQMKDDNRVDGKIMVAHSFKRVCYYLLNGGKDGRLDINQLELHICSHLIVGYARISTNGLVVTQKPLEDTEKYQQLTLMKLQYPQLKILLSIGDRGGAMFSIVASNNRTRDRFIMSILDFCHEFNFDGVDIDWEFPGFHTPGSFRDRENLILLLKDLRLKSKQFWKRKRTKKGDSFLISLAVGAPLIIASTSYTIPDIGKYVDFVNLMSYDFHYYRPDKPYTGHHSPLYPRSTDNAYFSTLNVAWTATYWANSGMPLEKIIVGVPTYARTYNLVVPIGQNMINVPASGPGIGKGKLNYTIVCQFLKMPGTIKQYDFHSQVPYAYKDFDWIAYENEMSVAIKAQWVIKTGMGGMVTFALNFDDSKGTCREDGKKFPLQKTISNLLELASIRSYRRSLHFPRVVPG